MSGSGRPTYRPSMGKANPSAAYVPTTKQRTRDLPGHTKIKRRQINPDDRAEMLKKIEALDLPEVNISEAKAFADIDADDDSVSDPQESSDEDDLEALRAELVRLKEERDRNAELLQTADFSTGLKWTEEAIFHVPTNPKPPSKEQYVNDPVRNKFLQDYLRQHIR